MAADNRTNPPAAWAGLLLAVLLGSSGGPALAEAVQLPSVGQTVLINLSGGLPGRWVSCVPDCRTVGTGFDTGRVRTEATLLRPVAGGSQFSWVVPGDPQATRALDTLQYEAQLWRSEVGATVILTSREPFGGMRLVHRYILSRTGRQLWASLQVPRGARLQLAGGEDLAGERLPGFGSLYSNVRAVAVNAAGQVTLTNDDAAPVSDRALPAGEWAGIRGRFWAVLLRPENAVRLDATETVQDQPMLSIRRESDSAGTLDLTIYGGPTAATELKAAAPELGGMLYASLWGWLRALAFGLNGLLGILQRFVGNWGLSILLLSLSVKFLMWPLTFVAERWQADVNRTQSLLQPELATIRREFKGEEAHRLTLEVYAKHGVSQFFTLKSLAGFLIQIPVFIAAFDMLGENFGLSGAPFLWVRDLALPDRALALPGVLPFFGGYLNLLPVLMTFFTILAARLQEDANLSPPLLANQRLRLYAMAAVFFVLLYTFPAGMVLYWATNNLLHLCKILVGKVAGRLRPALPA